MHANTRQMLAQLDAAIMDAIWVPNTVEIDGVEVDVLPEDMQDNREGGRTLGRILAACEQRDGVITEHQRRKAVKARNIERLAAQVSGRNIDEPLDYSANEVDELTQYDRETSFVRAALAARWLDADDLIDDDDCTPQECYIADVSSL